uniref:Uncharacterized protein n=1 Tax=Plectus sambesii TaxID=2011161 RepID=A0A914XGY8_9BILA
MDHGRADCKLKNAKCHFWKKTGYIQAACLQQQRFSDHHQLQPHIAFRVCLNDFKDPNCVHKIRLFQLVPIVSLTYPRTGQLSVATSVMRQLATARQLDLTLLASRLLDLAQPAFAVSASSPQSRSNSPSLLSPPSGGCSPPLTWNDRSPMKTLLTPNCSALMPPSDLSSLTINLSPYKCL